jgi:tRNA(Arg) A34 adenosine deaminase TadA
MMPAQSKGHILVVEPNDITRKLIVGILNNNGYGTYEAANGAQAGAFLNKDIQLVLLDAEEESADSLGFMRKLQMGRRALPVVVMTEAGDGEVSKRLDMPRLSVLEKPVVPEKLLGDIEGHLIQGVEKKISAGKEESAAWAQAASEGDPQAHEQRRQYMRQAIDISQQKMDQNCGGPFGAVVVKNGRVIAEGWNEVTSTGDPTAHAEMQAIRKAARALGDYRLEGCEIYTSCEPCPMCLAAIYWARIDRIFYANTREDAERIGFDDDFIYREFALPENRRTLPSRMMLRDEAQIVFDNWMKKGDKTSY